MGIWLPTMYGHSGSLGDKIVAVEVLCFTGRVLNWANHGDWFMSGREVPDWGNHRGVRPKSKQGICTGTQKGTQILNGTRWHWGNHQGRQAWRASGVPTLLKLKGNPDLEWDKITLRESLGVSGLKSKQGTCTTQTHREPRSWMGQDDTEGTVGSARPEKQAGYLHYSNS